MYRIINIKSILLTFVALWFFAHGFKILGYLYNIEMAKEVRAGTFEVTGKRFSANELVTYSIFPFYAYHIGYLVGFIACILLSNRKKADVIEAFIVLILFIFISYFGLTGWNNYLKHILLTPGAYLDGIGYFLVNGILMLLIGICFLILKKKVLLSRRNSQLNEHYA